MPATPDKQSQETVLAFDFGLRRIGVAVGQTITGSANPLGTIVNGPTGPDWKHIERLVSEWDPQRLIVGMPAHVDGTQSRFSDAVENFVEGLRRFTIPIDNVDERYSSLEAQDMLTGERKLGLRGRVSKGAIDAVAATLIAERWLRGG